MSWNQVNGTIAPDLEEAKEKAKDYVNGRDEVAIISKAEPSKYDKEDRIWWDIDYYESEKFSGRVIVSDNIDNQISEKSEVKER